MSLNPSILLVSSLKDVNFNTPIIHEIDLTQGILTVMVPTIHGSVQSTTDITAETLLGMLRNMLPW
jgi:hypothetical protein